MKNIFLLFSLFVLSLPAMAQLNCNASISASMNTAQSKVTLTNNSTPTPSSTMLVYYNISWGDGNTTSAGTNATQTHTYITGGNYTIRLTSFVVDSNSNQTCRDTAYANVTAPGKPCATQLSYIAHWNGAYNFNAANLNGTSNLTFNWNFGDGTSGTGSSINHTYTTSGTFNVRLIASNGSCADTHYKTIVVDLTKHCHPDSTDFSYSPNGLTVQFNNALGLVPGHYRNGTVWSFGDGNTSGNINPSHTYASAGTYTVRVINTLIDSNFNNATCQDTVTKIITVTTSGQPNKIAGFVHGDSANGTQNDSFKVWLITFNQSTNILTAVDSQVVSGWGFGSYSFANKASGSYRTKAAHLNGPSSGTGWVPTYHDSALLWSNANVINHTGGTSYNNIYLKTGTVVTGPGFVGGNVQQGANKGTANGIKGMTVLLLNTQGDPIRYATTDANGDYEFNNIPNGTYTVHPEQLAFTTTRATVNITNGSSTVTSINFERSLSGRTIKPLNNSVENISSDQLSFSVYPNPAKETVYIEWNSVSNEVAHISISDVSGKVMMTAEKGMNTRAELDVTQLNAGFYMLNITTEAGRKTQKLLLQ